MKRTTTTTKVMEYLIREDDFRNQYQIMHGIRESTNRTCAALHHLKKFKAVGAMDVDGTPYFYATPGEDTRQRHYDEKEEETVPRKPRKSRARKPQASA